MVVLQENKRASYEKYLVGDIRLSTISSTVDYAVSLVPLKYGFTATHVYFHWEGISLDKVYGWSSQLYGEPNSVVVHFGLEQPNLFFYGRKMSNWLTFGDNVFSSFFSVEFKQKRLLKSFFEGLSLKIEKKKLFLNFFSYFLTLPSVFPILKFFHDYTFSRFRFFIVQRRKGIYINMNEFFRKIRQSFCWFLLHILKIPKKVYRLFYRSNFLNLTFFLQFYKNFVGQQFFYKTFLRKRAYFLKLFKKLSRKRFFGFLIGEKFLEKKNFFNQVLKKNLIKKMLVRKSRKKKSKFLGGLSKNLKKTRFFFSKKFFFTVVKNDYEKKIS